MDMFTLPPIGIVNASTQNINSCLSHLDTLVFNIELAKFILTIPQQNLRCALCLRVFQNNKQTKTLENSIDLELIELFIDMMENLLISPDYQDEIENIIEYLEQVRNDSRSLNVSVLNKINHVLEKYSMNKQNDIFFDEIVVAQNDNDVRGVIYDDMENVHNSTINTSTTAAVKNLCEYMNSSITCFINSINDQREENAFMLKQIVYINDDVSVLCKRIAIMFGIDPCFLIVKDGCLKSGLNITVTDPNVIILSPVEIDTYNLVLRRDDFILVHDFLSCSTLTDYKKKCFESVFIASNTFLNRQMSQTDVDFFLTASHIENADIYWQQRNSIKTQISMLLKEPEYNPILRTNMGYKIFSIHESFVLHVFESINLVADEGLILSFVSEMTLIELLNAVWKFILKTDKEVQNEIKKRLKEELQDCDMICISGLKARLISSIQGFFDDEQYPFLKIRMSVEDQQFGEIIHKINKQARLENNDPIIDRESFKVIMNKILKEYNETNHDRVIQYYKT